MLSLLVTVQGAPLRDAAALVPPSDGSGGAGDADSPSAHLVGASTAGAASPGLWSTVSPANVSGFTPAWAAHVRTTERVGCLSFHELEAAAGDFPLDTAVSASFVLTMPDSSRNESLTLELLERLRPTRRVFVVENPGYKACPKPSLCKNASNFDLADAKAQVFRYARAHIPNTTVLLLEDDFFWAADELLSTAAPGPLTRSRLAAVASFVAAHASEIDHYSLGCLPFRWAPPWSANEPDHRAAACGGAHAVLHTPVGMTKYVERLERDPCLQETLGVPLLDHFLGLDHTDAIMAGDRLVMYHKPLAYQTFEPGTANYESWPFFSKAGLSIGAAVAPELAQRPPEPAWSRVYAAAIAAGDAESSVAARVRSALNNVTTPAGQPEAEDTTPPALSGVTNGSPQRFDQTTPNVGRGLGARVVNDVADGYNELVNDLPLDKLRDDVHSIGRIVGVGT